MQEALEQLRRELHDHMGHSSGAQTPNLPHTNLLPVYTSLPVATRDRLWEMVGLRGVPGSTPDRVYICLGDAAATPAYSWVQVA